MQVNHVRRRVGGAQNAIRIEQAVGIRCFKPAGQNRLKNIAVYNVLLGLVDDVAVFFLGHVAGELRLAVLVCDRQLHRLANQTNHFFDFCARRAVIFQDVVGRHVDDDIDFL